MIKPKYESLHSWEDYSSSLTTEYTQSIEEGLNISSYSDLFKAVSALPRGETRTKLADVIFEIVHNAPIIKDYKYNEPNELDDIKALRKPYPLNGSINNNTLEKQLHGAWMGRIAGCFLGKAVEGIKSNEFIPFLKKSGNYPMYRYILSTDCTAENCKDMKYNIGIRNIFPDTINYMPSDDDTNYVVLAQQVIENYGRDFTSDNMMEAWLKYQPKDAYCTAERRAFVNFIQGYRPPYSAMYQNPYREWIGAQIRGDYFGYINPGDPQAAAEMAYRDARISHIKNGIYGEMFASAMIAAAAVTDDIKEIIFAGLGEIPATSRLYEDVTSIITMYDSGATWQEVTEYIHGKWDENTSHGWCHTISNAMICAMALLFGDGDFGKTICLAVQTCFDTDCNGATVGSVIGMAKGIEAIGDEWKSHFNDTLLTQLFGITSVKISECAKKTLSHL